MISRTTAGPSLSARSSAAILLGLQLFAGPMAAQGASSDLSVKADWLQAAAMPLHRQTMHSGSVSIQKQAGTWAYDVGFLRAARSLSTIQSGFVVVSRPLEWGDAVFFPGLGGSVGYAQSSRDTSGYDWVSATTTATGHVPRYTRFSGVTVGGGASFAVEYPSRSTVGVRASVSQWMFSGDALTGDRQRTMAGAGLTLRFGGKAGTSSKLTPAARKEAGR